MPSHRKRYAQVGLGGRSIMYTEAIVDRYRDFCDLVGLCDVNRCRMDLVNRKIAGRHASVPTCKADHHDGTYSILVGVAACRSIDSGRPVKISDLLGETEKLVHKGD